MRTAIHPNRSWSTIGSVNRISNDLSGVGIVDLSDANVAGLTAHRVSDRMRNALPLVSGKNGFVPALRFEPSGFVDRQTTVVTDLDALPVIDVFMRQIAP